MAYIKRKLSKKEQKAVDKSGPQLTFLEKKALREASAEPRAKKEVHIPEVISVKDFAEVSGLPVTQVITVLMKSGILANINETIDFETAAIIGDDLGLEILKEEENTKTVTKEATNQGDKKGLVLRPPVVTIMGHVDHGKTSLLDKIREARVAEGESGGITQHISAYQVSLPSAEKGAKDRIITFIDTPGHAAFSAMREHGTAITDIVVLIVAAQDGVMPQTKEVIDQCKMNNVPVIVAINKIDLPDADVMKVKQQLAEFDLVPEEWGGKTVMVEVSAKTGQNIESLLEMILLQADMMDLRANPAEKAIGIVIESHMQKGAGAMALVLVENGTLKRGDPIAIGRSYGRVRILENYFGQPIEEAGPSFPVRVAGLKSIPNFGDRLIVFDSEKEAKQNAGKVLEAASEVRVATARKISGEDGNNRKKIEFNIVLKADVQGSLEAIKKSLLGIDTMEAQIKLVSEGVGTISESDITLAKATGAEVIGFRVKTLGAARKIAEEEKIHIFSYDIIYELIDHVKSAISELLPPEIIEEELGNGEVLAIFRDDKKGFVAGGIVKFGKISIKNEIKIYQAGNEKYRARIDSLRKEKSEAKDCESGTECGFGLPIGANVSVGDTFVAFKTIEKKRIIK